MLTHSFHAATTSRPRGTLVIIPGVNSGAYLFAGAVTTLGQEWHLLFITPPGVAGAPMALPFTVASYARYVLDIITRHAPDGPLAVLGHSLGSFCAQEVARTLLATPSAYARTPFSHLVLVSSSPGQPYTAQDVARMQFAEGKSFWQTVRDIEKEPETGMRLFFGSWADRHPHAFQQFIQQRKQQVPSPAASLSQLTAGGLFSSNGWARTLNIPALCLHGINDVLVSPTAGRVLADLLPQGRWLAYHDVGHFPMLEHPHFYRHVQEFLATTTDQPANTAAKSKTLVQRLRESFFSGVQQQAQLSFDLLTLPLTHQLDLQRRLKAARHG